MLDQLSYASMDNQVQTPKPPLANQIVEEFNELNQRQGKLISAIENRLHSIIDKRVPQKEGEPKCDNGVNDFRTTIGDRIVALRINTNRLDQILSHLEEIV